MANGLYAKFEEDLLDKIHDLNTDAIHATLYDGADYTPNLATDQTYDVGTVPAAAKVAAFGPLTSPTITDGTFDTADFTWSAVSGDQSEGIVLWNNTPTTPVNDPLIANYDTGITGMPVTPNGGDINVTVNASGWWTR